MICSSQQTALSHKFTFCDDDDIRLGNIKRNVLQYSASLLQEYPMGGFGSADMSWRLLKWLRRFFYLATRKNIHLFPDHIRI
jgi:hypothetical protein